MAKKALTAVVVLALLGAIAAGIWWWNQNRQVKESSAWGNVDARKVSLAFEASGRIKELFKEEGEAVHPGERLGVLDTRAREIDLAQAKAQLEGLDAAWQLAQEGYRREDIEAAQAAMKATASQLALAERTEKRQAQLLASKATTVQAWENARWQRETLQNQLRSAQADWDKLSSGLRPQEVRQQKAARDAGAAAVAALEYQIGSASVIESPATGVVRSRLAEPGDMVSAAKTVYEIAVTDPKWVRAFVSETQLKFVREGAQALVTTDTTAPLTATVGYVSSQAEFMPKTVQTQDLRSALVYEVRLNVRDPDNALKLGQPVTVDFAPTASELSHK